MRTSLLVACTFMIAAPLAAQTDAACPSGSDDIRTAALSGLVQMDGEQVLPALKKILERRDPCSVSLRKQVLGMLVRSRYGDQTDLLLDVARRDANDEVRRYAVQLIARTTTERSVTILDSIINRGTEVETRDVALRALAQESAPAARASVRRVAENAALPPELRTRAVSALGSGRHAPDDASYFIGLYPRVEQPELREAVLRAIANQRTSETTAWLLGIAKDKSKDIEVRRQALYTVSQSLRSNESGATGIDLPKLLGLYDDFAGQIEMQDRALDMIAQRPESLATDNLLQIARSESNVELRRKAILRVGQRRDPRVREFLMEVLAK